MTFLVWRQYRLQWTIALALLAGFAAVELATGFQMTSAWHSLLTRCAAGSQPPAGDSCLQAPIASTIGNYLRLLSEMVPGVLGIFWGAPLVAGELETGTATFTWTQGITRARWLWAKVGWLLLAAALWGGAVSALVTWWSGPVNAQQGNAFLANSFDTQGIVPIGYSVFAMALGIAAGAVLRQTLPAIAVTIAGFIPVRLLVAQELRQHLVPVARIVVSLTSNWAPPGIGFIVSTGLVGPSGQPLAANAPNGAYTYNGVPFSDFPAACQQLQGGPPGTGAASTFDTCLARAGFRQYFTYQPGSHYWPVQGVETGLYVLVAAALLAIAWLAVRRRDA